LAEAGHDTDIIKSKIKDTVRKAVITLEPYLLQFYYTTISTDHSTAKCFHLVGFDILLDHKLNAWLMEINANPSFNMFLERDLPNGEVEKTLSELDRYVKSKVISEAIRIVTVSIHSWIVLIGARKQRT
jgi:Tubulin-tyrosine ligase family